MLFKLNGAGCEVEAVRPVKSRPPVPRKQNSAPAQRRPRPLQSRHSIAAIGWNNTLGGVCVCMCQTGFVAVLHKMIRSHCGVGSLSLMHIFGLHPLHDFMFDVYTLC